MNQSMIFDLILLLVLLILSGLFSSAETSLVGCSRVRIKTLAEDGNKRAKICEKLFEQESKMLSAILIGNNLVNTYMASIASMIAYNFGGAAVSIATFIITFLILVFGEITPKNLATLYSERMALFYAPIIYWLMKILTPIIWFINLFSKGIMRMIGIKEKTNTSVMTENEIRTIVDMSHEGGVIEEDEKDFINNVFDFGTAKAKDVMVPRVHVVRADEKSTYKELKELFQKEQYTRIPIYRDNVDNIVGFINMKDLLLLDHPEDYSMAKLLRKPYFTVENKNVSDLLAEMKHFTINMAIVLDEYGELAGIVTVEDIIEEIVGNLHDEYDSHEMEQIQNMGNGTYLVKGFISLHDLNDALDTNLNSEDFDSIGGLMIDKLGRIPTLNEEIEIDGIKLKVTEVKGNRIETIRLTLPPKENEG